MTIDKAIEIKTRTGEEFLNTDPDEIDEADRLCVEAAKHIQQNRERGKAVLSLLLPGETFD